MLLNWCLKGIAESSTFGDTDAEDVILRTGILSNWMRAHRADANHLANITAQDALSAQALDDHVNNYGSVAADTPYISLSAGCYEYQGDKVMPRPIRSIETAALFATQGGTTAGYIFRCWALTSPKPAPAVNGVADEVRNLNLFSQFYRYHVEGEIAAKLVVPRRHIQWVMKVDMDTVPVAAGWAGLGATFHNPEFIWPASLSNEIEAL
jgi:hypothetical protein